MPDRYVVVESLLIDIEYQLRRLGLWEQEPPAAEALASTEPFAIDTMDAPQWLQFVFLPRLRELAATASPLPAQCSVAPYLEEYFAGTRHDARELLAALLRLDNIVRDS